MSDIVSFDHHGVMVTIFRQRGQYGYRLRVLESGRKIASVTGFAGIAVAKAAAETRAREVASATRGAA